MNWLTKISQVEDSYNLSLVDLRRLQYSVMSMGGDITGQGYLFDMPEIQRWRQEGGRSASDIAEIRKYFNDIFEDWGEGRHNWANDDIGQDEINNEIDSLVEMYVSVYSFSDHEDKMYSFMNSLGDQVPTAFRNAISDNVIKQLEDPNTSQQVFSQIMAEAEKWMQANEKAGFNPTMEILEELNQEFAEFQAEDPNVNVIDPLLDKISYMTREVMEGLLEYAGGDYNYTSNYKWNELPEEKCPNWIDWKKLQMTLSDDFSTELSDWYKDDSTGMYGGLQDQAAESISENRHESISELNRDWKRSHGFEPEELFDEYEREDHDENMSEDPGDDFRYELTLGSVQDLANDIGEAWIVKDNYGKMLSASLRIGAISKVIARNPELSSIFAGEAENLSIDNAMMEKAIWNHLGNDIKNFPSEMTPEYIQNLSDGDSRTLSNNFKTLPQSLQGAGLDRLLSEMRDNVAIRDERRRVEDERLAQEEAIRKQQEEKMHEQLKSRTTRMTEQELNKMRELGIAQKTFPHRYMLERGDYPGHFIGNELASKMTPFRISVSPEIDASVVPPGVYDLAAHSVGNPSFPEDQGRSFPALGWIGGYADYETQTMYILEVQSDIMQNTVHMRDPAKVRKQNLEEIESLQNKILLTQQKIDNLRNQGSSGPKANLSAKIERIKQENLSLHPTSPKYNQNLSLVDRLETQLANMPDDASNSSGRSEEAMAKLIQEWTGYTQQKESIESKKVPNVPSWLSSRSPSRFHDYKSKIENLFKHWVPIFFNVAMREARNRGFKKVRIIDADTLYQKWKTYSKEETKQLFERIYDKTAQERYNAIPVREGSFGLWEVDLGNPNLRIAKMHKNWLQKISSRKLASNWLVKNPETGREVWQDHLDAYFNFMSGPQMEQIYNTTKEMLEGPTEKYDTEMTYVDVDPLQEEELHTLRQEKNIFKLWLHQVPPDLKDEKGDLIPEFKKQVRNYLLRSQGFDPYEAEDEDIAVPSAAEMDEWFAQ